MHSDANDPDLWNLMMLPDGPHPINLFRSSKTKRKEKISAEPARFVYAIFTCNNILTSIAANQSVHPS